MQHDKKTKIQISQSYPTGISSSIFGANFNGLAFNIDYILRRNPQLAVEIISNYEQSNKLPKEELPHNHPDLEYAWQKFKLILGGQNG